MDAITDNLEEAMTWVEDALARQEPKSVGLVANAAQALPELVQRGVVPDVVTDQTSAHDPLYGYIPAGMTLAEAAALREADPAEYQRQSMDSMARHVQAMLDLRARGVSSLTTATICASAPTTRRQKRFRLPRFCAGLHPPTLLRRQGTFPLGGPFRRSQDLYITDQAILDLFPRQSPGPLDSHGAGEGGIPGLPARILLVGLRRAGRSRAEIQRTGGVRKVSAPIVIGRDHLDSGSVASPNRETEGMLDGSDAIADWPLLNALVNAVGERRGSASITAAALASAIASMPDRSSSPTALRRRRAGCNAC